MRMSSRMRISTSTRILFVIMATGFFSCAKIETKPPAMFPEEVPVEGKYKGTLIPDNTLRVPLEGVVVTAGTLRLSSNARGEFTLPDLPKGKHLLLAEKRFPAGPVRRVLGVEKIFVTDRGPDPVRIRLRDATDVDAFCLDCHPPKSRVERADQIYRDIHPSGIFPKVAKKNTGKFDESGRVTCESCHSIHRPTGFPHFVLVSYQDAKLCEQCH